MMVRAEREAPTASSDAIVGCYILLVHVHHGTIHRHLVLCSDGWHNEWTADRVSHQTQTQAFVRGGTAAVGTLATTHLKWQHEFYCY